MPFPDYRPGPGGDIPVAGRQAVNQQRIGEAAAWMSGWLLATLGMTVAGRELTKALPVIEVMQFRSVIATLALLPIVIHQGNVAARFGQFKLHAARNVVHFGGQYLWFTALLMIPLAEVIAIEFTMPLWIAILAALFLGERIHGFKIAALAIGFAGILMIVKPGHEVNWGHPVALGAALLFSGSVTLTKLITRKDTALTVIFMMFAIQSALGAVPAWLAWVPPERGHILWIAVVAVSGTGSHYCLSRAISLADATVVMPMDFLRLPLTALVAWLVYHEANDAWSILGALLILAANTLNLAKARRL